MPRRALLATLIVVVAVMAVLLLASGQEPAGPTGQAQPGPAARPAAPTTHRLSDERRRTLFAFVQRSTVARTRPDARARGVRRLDPETEDRTPELVVALEQTRAPQRSRRWVRVRLPARPNGVTAWVPRRDLGRFHVVTTALRVDRSRMTAELSDRGRVVWRSRVAVGTHSAPTPAGRFYVRSRIIPDRSGGPYGVYAFGTNGYSPGRSDWPGGGVVGLHGTDQPGLIPGRVSQGCVRIRNTDIARLRDLMPLGTPIEII